MGSTSGLSSGRIGDTWRGRYESLTLFTPRSFSALPGITLAGDPDGYPSREEFADYLGDFALRSRLPVLTGVRVVELVHDGGFLAALSNGRSVRSLSVVVATGGFQKPVRPALAEGFDTAVRQFDPETYHNPQDVPPGRVLVVGDGASGRDIAAELAATHETVLAAGKPRRLFPERILGKTVWWWLRSLGLMRARADSLQGRMMRRADPFPDRGRSLSALKARGVRIAPRLTTAEGRVAAFADGSRVGIAAVVWAIGYRDDYDWLAIPEAKDGEGGVLQTEGVSHVPGLFFVGRPWQRNRASALVMGAGEDAQAIVRRISLAR